MLGQIYVTRSSEGSAQATNIVAAAGTVLAANAQRLWWGIQNLSTGALFVKFGANASTTDFHIVLKAGTAQDDGLGGVFFDDTWDGIVSVASAGSVRCSVIEVNNAVGS